MQPAQMLNQLGIQLELLRGAANLAPLNQSQLERLNALEDRLLDLMERSLDAALREDAPKADALAQAHQQVSEPAQAPSQPSPSPRAVSGTPGVTTIRVPAPKETSPPLLEGSSFPFRTTGQQHISELIQGILPPAIGRGLSFDELSHGVKLVLSDSPEVKTQRPPPGTLLELGGLLRAFAVDPAALHIEPEVG